jgi:hypothetical protein
VGGAAEHTNNIAAQAVGMPTLITFAAYQRRRRTMKLHFVFLTFVSYVFISSCFNIGDIKISELDKFQEIDTFENGKSKSIVRSDYFLIENGGNDLNKIMLFIDSGIKKNGDSISIKYDQYQMLFYSSSREINMAEIKTDSEYIKNKIMPYYEPSIMYIWFNGKLANKMKFKDRKLLE